MQISVMCSSFALMGAGCFGGASAPVSSGGAWDSADAGKTWTQIAAVPTVTGVNSLSEVNVTSLTIDPQDSSVLYMGTEANGMFYSLDKGQSWQRPEEPLVRTGAVTNIAVSAQDVCTYFIAKSDRVMKTEDCGRTFASASYLEGRSETTITAIAIDWYDSNIVWIGNSEGDVIRSTDGGASWATVTRLDDDITSIIVSNADSRVVMVGTNTNGMNRTTDSGATWTNFEKTLKAFKSSDRVFGFAQNAAGDFLLMNTKFGLLSSVDNGATWSGISLISGSGEIRIRSVAIAPETRDTIYYATDLALHRSTSSGSAWTTTELPSSRAGAALLVDPDDASHIYLGSAIVSSK
jgi:photosystem II stability/assembly factor-like uncharacterized protein